MQNSGKARLFKLKREQRRKQRKEQEKMKRGEVFGEEWKTTQEKCGGERKDKE